MQPTARRTAPLIATGEDSIAGFFERSRDLAAMISTEAAFLATVAAIADRITAALQAGHKLLLAGNGGSAADAQHIAAEFLSRYSLNRQPLPAIALTTDSSALTAIGNDFGFDQIFARQVGGLGRPGDVFLAISTSGRSPNVLAALEAARAGGVATVGFCGSDSEAMRPLCDLLLVVPSAETALIQQIQLTAAHAICGRVERAMFATSAAARPTG
jgi:D-sedoheptulose 7-phosphate isomerase